MKNKIKIPIQLILAITFTIAVFAIILLGFFLLKKYNSKSFILKESIIGIEKEIQNSYKTKALFTLSDSDLVELKKHTITKTEDIRFIVEKIENHADDLNLPITIERISLTEEEDSNKKKLTGAEIAKAKKEALDKEKQDTLNNIVVVKSSPVYIKLSLMGDLNKLVDFIKMIENSDYLLSTTRYSLEEVALVPPDVPGGKFIVQSTRSGLIKDYQSITWSLKMDLVAVTHIK